MREKSSVCNLEISRAAREGKLFASECNARSTSALRFWARWNAQRLHRADIASSLQNLEYTIRNANRDRTRERNARNYMNSKQRSEGRA